mgnify:CR=1 FL=1
MKVVNDYRQHAHLCGKEYSAMEKTDLRIRKTLRSIDTALLENLSQYEFQKITVEMICSSAMINKSTFYKYYADKYQLLDLFLDRTLEEFRQALQSTDFILATPDTIDDPVYVDNFRKSVDVIYAKRKVYQTLWNARFGRNIFGEMVGIVRENILRTLLLEPCQSKEAMTYRELYASLFAANAMEMFHWWFDHENEITAEDVRRLINRNMKEGLFTTFKTYCI